MATYNGHNEDSNGNILLNVGNGITATVETGSTASQGYNKGEYLFFNNRLCKASTAITSGATLSIGTNLLETNVGAELSSHLRASDGKEFYFDKKDGVYGYYTSSAKSSSDFNTFARKAIKLATNESGTFTVDCTSIINYQNLTVSNFILEIEQLSVSALNFGFVIDIGNTTQPSLSYDAQNGILSVNCPPAEVGVPNQYYSAATATVGVWFID